MNQDNWPTIKFNLFLLRQELETRQRRRYSWEEVARKSGLSSRALIGMVHNQHKQVRFTSIQGLLSFFHNEGMPIGLQDLLVVTPPSHANQKNLPRDEKRHLNAPTEA